MSESISGRPDNEMSEILSRAGNVEAFSVLAEPADDDRYECARVSLP